MHSKRKWLPGWQRVELVGLCLDRGMSRREAASLRLVSVSTVQYWVDRYRQATDAQRESGSWAEDRPSTPHRQPTRVSDEIHDRVCDARRRTGWGARLIASELGIAHATVSRCFSRPGHALTGDRHRSGAEKRMKVGWEFCHSIIDDHSRLAFTEIHPDEKAGTVTAFVERALAFFAGHGIEPKRLQTDNAFVYIKNRSLRELLAARAIKHRRIPPRTPKRNGKVERYQQTLAREWAYRQRYRNSDCREAALPIWLEHYNFTRNHSSLSNRPPISRVRNDPRHNT
jgi:transposase InsO family protein